MSGFSALGRIGRVRGDSPSARRVFSYRMEPGRARLNDSAGRLSPTVRMEGKWHFTTPLIGLGYITRQRGASHIRINAVLQSFRTMVSSFTPDRKGRPPARSAGSYNHNILCPNPNAGSSQTTICCGLPLSHTPAPWVDLEPSHIRGKTGMRPFPPPT